MLCEESLGKVNAKDLELFRNRLVHEFYRASGIICFFFSANYALFFGELCELHNIFKQTFLMFQFSKLANQAQTSNKHLISVPEAVCP